MNPSSGTRITAEDESDRLAPLRSLPTRQETMHLVNVGVVTMEVESYLSGVLAIHVGDNPQVPTGAVIVTVRGMTEDGLPIGVAYADLANAGRGERYAMLYYERLNPALREGRNEGARALEDLHRSNDLADPAIALARDAALASIAANHADGGERRQRAAADAERARQLFDRLGRRNPGAAAMANAWTAIQLDTQLRTGLKAERRVSASLAAIIELTGRVWKAFHDADAELLSMERWWQPTRSRPLTAEKARELAVRVRKAEEQVRLIRVAPYGNMPLVSDLLKCLTSMAESLEGGAFRDAIQFLVTARRLLSVILIHPSVVVARAVAGEMRRFGRPATDDQRRRYLQALDRAHTLSETATARERGAERGSGMDAVLVYVSRHVRDAIRQGLATDLDAHSACAALDSALSAFAHYQNGHAMRHH